METFVTPLMHGIMEEDWMDAYWVLQDCLWAVECAVTQRFVDLRRQTGVFGSNHISVDTDEILEQLWHTRTSLVISIFHVTGPMQPAPALLESLAITLLDWDEDLEHFLARQDSMLQQQRPPARSSLNRPQHYGKHISDLSPYFEAAMTSFADWLPGRKPSHEQFSIKRAGVTPNDMQEMVRDWVIKMAAPNAESISKEQEVAALPIYVVDCPKLHAISKKILEHKLRWTDKWAFEAVQGNSPIVNWKEGIACPSCAGGEKIKLARLIEPLQLLTTALDTSTWRDDYSLSQYSVAESGSYDAASGSRSTGSDSGSIVPSLTSNSAMSVSQPSHVSRPSDLDIQVSSSLQLPRYTESPISPATYHPPSARSHSLESALEWPVSPINESLNVPIALPIASRLSVDLPIPVNTPIIDESRAEAESASMPSELSSGRTVFTPTSSIRSTPSFGKMKPSRTIRIGSSFRRKPSMKEKESTPLPKEPCFVFSAAGHSLLLWERGANHLIRFDVPSNDASAIQGCRYEVTGIESAAAGNHKCAIIATTGLSARRLVIFNSINIKSEAEIDLDLPGKLGEVCVVVSRNDRFAAVSLNDQILIFGLESGEIKKLAFHHHIDVYETRGGILKRRTIPVGRTTSDDALSTLNDFDGRGPGWFGGQGRGLSSREKAEEQQRQTVIISRKINFSTDSKCLVVATQLGDHCIYVDVWDCTKEPVSTVTDNSRSFKMPPWTLNDGDLTSVFYDSDRRAALVTAFLGKEYPLLIPFPGHDNLQNETYSTKVLHAAQSPKGETFAVINTMTEIIQFEYTMKGMLSPRKLKKASSKISQGVFKPGAIALAMPLENILQIFWVKDGKCMLRSVKIGAVEQFKDYDIRPHYDRLMSLKTKPIIARAPSLMIPELDAT